jgi:hypothetical protein
MKRYKYLLLVLIINLSTSSFAQSGCTDPLACNFVSTAVFDDGSCNYLGSPCDDGNSNTLFDALNANCECIGLEDYQGCGNDIFISEYVEGTANNKAIELFNPTNDVIVLDGVYSMGRERNGNAIPMLLPLTGSIPPFGTRVFVLDKRDPNGTGIETPISDELASRADTFVDPVFNEVFSPFYFNGDDSFFLVKNNNALLDMIGKFGEDPGTGWTSPPGLSMNFWTTDNTMRRKSSIYQGVTSTILAVFDPGLEWDTLGLNNFSGLGWHHIECVNFIVGCMDPSACNYSQEATIDSENCVFPSCADVSACNYNPESTCNDDSCILPGMNCDDGNSNTFLDQIDDNCECLGISLNFGSIISDSLISCVNSDPPVITAEAPSGFEDYELQWFYKLGSHPCPEISSLNDWTEMPFSNSLEIQTPMLYEAATFACLVTLTVDGQSITGMMENCAVIQFLNTTENNLIEGEIVVQSGVFYDYEIPLMADASVTWNVENGSFTTNGQDNVIQVIWEDGSPNQLSATINYSSQCVVSSSLIVGSSLCENTVIVEQPANPIICPNNSSTISAEFENTIADDAQIQWYLNGTILTDANEDVLTILESGVYQCALISTNCFSISNPIYIEVLSSEGNPTISIQSFINECGEELPLLVTETPGLTNIVWNDGTASDELLVVESGTYSFIAENSLGCAVNSESLLVNIPSIPAIELCSVSALMGNSGYELWWSGEDVLPGSQVLIHRQILGAPNSEIIGTANFDEGSFVDNDGTITSPVQYFLSYVSPCGIASENSPQHQPSFLTGNILSNNGWVELNWTAYIGTLVEGYSIFQILDGQEMLMAQVGPNSTSFVDSTPILDSQGYFVRAELPDCFAFDNSQSNIWGFIEDSVESIEEGSFNVYPNPSNGVVRIRAKSKNLPISVQVVDTFGKRLETYNSNSSDLELDLSSYSSGIYYLIFMSNLETEVVKLILTD